MKALVAAAAGLVLMVFAAPASAQERWHVGPAAEFTAGYAGFVDDATIHTALLGGAARLHILPQVSVGPEVQYMIRPGDARILVVTGNITADIFPPDSRVTPFLVGGIGVLRYSDRTFFRTYTSYEPACTIGGGVRTWLNDRVYTTGEFRLGWELGYRLTGTIGVQLGR